VIPLFEVVGNGPKLAPEQYDPRAANVGVILELMVIVIVVVLAHCPAEGVKVYVVVALLFIAGLHVPVIPFVEVVGNGPKLAPGQ
jgi:hypothetical protein